MTDLTGARSHSSMNIENLTSIPVGGSITLINYAHRQLPAEYSQAKDRGWAWVVCAGSFFVMFMVYGIHTSFGVLLVVLLDHFDTNKASTGKCFRTVTQNRIEKEVIACITSLQMQYKSLATTVSSFHRYKFTILARYRFGRKKRKVMQKQQNAFIAIVVNPIKFC